MEINGSGGSLIERKYRLPVTVIGSLPLIQPGRWKSA